MTTFRIVPAVEMYSSCAEFSAHNPLGKGDLVFISRGMRERYFKDLVHSKAQVVDYRPYVEGEPTDTMVEAIARDLQGITYNRVVAIGGGTILDVAKLFALRTVTPVVDLFQKKREAVKTCELILIPTTCGTGSEVTNISILELTAIGTKMGLADDALFADRAVLIPELLEELPHRFFATSSIDALIHAVESYTSPKANNLTRMYSEKAMDMIITGYRTLAREGEAVRKSLMADFLMASTYAGIAFGNAGCAAVHAMSYPLGATYHVPHGESNYVFFTRVYRTYQALQPEGSIQNLNAHLASLLECPSENVYDALDNLLDTVMPRRTLKEYGVQPVDLETFTHTVMTKQGRLMANNYTPLDTAQVLAIYQSLY